MYLQIPGRQFEGCSLTADTHCAFSSNLFHRQIGPILLKSHRVWGWFVPKNLHFLISGPPSWRKAIWTICRWNRFEEKAQCEIGLKLRDHYDSWKCSRNAHNVVRQKHESSISRPTSFQSCAEELRYILMSIPKSAKQAPSSGLLMFSWHIWDPNLTDNSKIGDEF